MNQDYTVADLFSLMGSGALWVLHAYLAAQMVEMEDVSRDTLFAIDEQIMETINHRRQFGSGEDMKLDYLILQQILVNPKPGEV